MYIYDTAHEIDNWMRESEALNRDVVEKIQQILNQYNPFVQTFHHIAQRQDLQSCRLIIKEQLANQRQYCLPSASQVAAIIVVGEGSENIRGRDIVVQTTDGQLKSIKDCVGYYDPLQYPLLLPYGMYGWDVNTRNNTNRKVTCCDYYSYVLQIRQHDESLLLRSGRLLQQYVVDNYVKIESQKLRWMHDNQHTIQSEFYRGLQDSLIAGQNSAGNIGRRRTILPSSFVGSPRDMYQRYQDAMTLVQKYGRPDIFLTMTCNPNWEEISDELLPGQAPQDRPDLLTRVFRAKFEQLKNDVIKKSPNDCDQMVRAEIPIPNEEPELYGVVLRHMIHGQCGIHNSRPPCMKRGRNDSYLVYRRRDNHNLVSLHQNARIMVDNRWVIPCNSWLLLIYDCHINVEICCSIKSVKYLYKYVYKGPDRVAFEVHPEPIQDEIKQFVDAICVCALETLWRIFKFSERMNNHKVIGRIYAVSPNEGEKFYLRILLNHVRGPTSFDDLRTVNDIIQPTFKKAVEQRGLLKDDDSIRQCLREASNIRMSSALRRLFVTILIYCEPHGVRRLWDEFHSFMVEDYSVSSTINNTSILNKLLQDLNGLLVQHSKSVSNYDLPQITQDCVRDNTLPRIIQDEVSLDISEADLNAVHNLNEDQMAAYNLIVSAIELRDNAIFFVDGPGGTGKTYLYRALLATLRSNGQHSRFKILLSPDASSTCSISIQSDLAELIRKTSVVVWDEAPIAFKTLDRMFKDIIGVDLPFEGKVMIFEGDFRQVLPVVPKGTRSELMQASMINASFWGHVKIIRLKHNMRSINDQDFSEFLLHVGNGEQETMIDDMMQIPSSMVIPWNGEESIVQFVNEVFPDLECHVCDSRYLVEMAIITPKNEDGDVRNLYQQEFLNSISPAGMPPHQLTLKKGAPIMLLRSIDLKMGLCNDHRKRMTPI
ncbi:unnamed protein product [Malus baccata var. baccata]